MKYYEREREKILKKETEFRILNKQREGKFKGKN